MVKPHNDLKNTLVPIKPPSSGTVEQIMTPGGYAAAIARSSSRPDHLSIGTDQPCPPFPLYRGSLEEERAI